MIKYFENGYVTLDGDMLLKLTDISLNYSVDTDETTSFDSDNMKEYEYGYGGWTATANGIVTSGETTPSKFSGESNVTGDLEGFDILEEVKNRTKLTLILKVDDSNYQTGTVLLTSFDLASAVGSKMTYSINLQGSGKLTKSTT